MPEARPTPKRVLIVRPSALGDVARTVPALASLKRAYPEAQVDWLVRDIFADCVRHHPDLHEVVAFPRSRFAKFGRNWSTTREAMAWLNELKARRYDAVYDLQGLSRSGLFAWWTRAKRRVGFHDARELAWLGYNVKHEVGDRPHTVDRMLGLLKTDGVPVVHDMRLHTAETDRAWAQRFIDRHQLGDNFAIFAPTAQWVSKQWPIERFAALAERLGNLNLSQAVVVGAPDEVEITRPLIEAGLVDAVGQTSVGQLMALAEGSALVVSNDSAALHLAIGLGRRCVGLYGPTDPAKVGPYRYDVGLVTAPGVEDTHYRQSGLGQEVIARITLDDVTDAARRVLDAPPPATLHERASAT